MAVGGRQDDRLVFTEAYRFDNRQIAVRGDLFWNIFGIYENLKNGLRQAAAIAEDCVSVGMDSFCNDFGIVDGRGTLLTQVHCYRDPRAERHQNFVYERISKEKLHLLTGNQNALFNTVMQLGALREQGADWLLSPEHTLLLLPDLLGYWLTGEMRTEYCNASVTQLFSPFTGDWSQEILDALGIARGLFAPIIQPGNRLGAVPPDLCRGLGVSGLEVVSVCSHDTASAVAALPTNEPDVAFISSGTWSLVGTEIPKPFTSRSTLAQNFAVEGCAEKGSRMLKNVMGLWLVQECRHSFAAQGISLDYARLSEMAEAEPPFRSLIDPDEPAFYMPGNMPEKIAQCCRRTGQPEPQTPGQYVRCILESLALKYRWVVERLEEINDKPLGTIHILGGGGRNVLLNQFTANACARRVRVGPTEAALWGNLLLQMKAYGEISSLAEGRQLLGRSCTQGEYTPQATEAWDRQYQRMLKLFNI